MFEGKAEASMRGSVINVSSQYYQSFYPLTLLQNCVNGNPFTNLL